MDWKTLLIRCIEFVCYCVVSFGIPYAVTLIHKKVKNEQLARVIDRAAEIIKKSVLLVNQTYVDALKIEGKFDKEAQEKAFEMCKQRVLAMLNDEAIKAIYDTFGDIDEWIRTQIEANVRLEKEHPLIAISESNEAVEIC